MPDLGFNSRAKREKWRAGGVVPGMSMLHSPPTALPTRVAQAPEISVNVGPGSYEVGGGAQVVDGKPGFAPFLSTTERKFGTETGPDLPGPGHYHLDDNPHPLYRGIPTDVFRSSTRRFETLGRRTEDTPGPGAYLGHGEFGRKDQATAGNLRGEADKIKWLRVPTAPSIPGKEQSYGYEEGEEGELVMQRPVDFGHSGRGDDRPGPVDYQPRVGLTRRTPIAVDFSKGEDRLVALSKGRVSTTPGPGYYNAVKGLGDPNEGTEIGRAIRRKRQRPSASFYYGSCRERPRKTQDTVPGPGDYSVPCGLDVKRDPRCRDLSFLTTSRRFEGPATGGSSRAPGPGSYNAVPSDFDFNRRTNRHRVPQSSFTEAPVGFQSTTLRFLDHSRGEYGLGPAQYSMPGMAEEIIRKAVGRGKKIGAFGSTTKRFPVRGSNLPGPGYYDLEFSAGSLADGKACSKYQCFKTGGTRGNRFPSALSAFASETKRFAPPSSATLSPAPGQYEVRRREKPRGVLKIGKQSKNRFKEPMSTLTPDVGPGSYDVRNLEQLGRARSRKNVMISSQARFTDPTKPRSEDSPGPGHYSSSMLYGNLLKQTYNIAIAEQSTDIL